MTPAAVVAVRVVLEVGNIRTRLEHMSRVVCRILRGSASRGWTRAQGWCCGMIRRQFRGILQQYLPLMPCGMMMADG